MAKRTRQRQSQPSPPRPAPNQTPAHMHPENSPAFAIPSGLGSSGFVPSPMDAFLVDRPVLLQVTDPPDHIMDLSGWSPLADGLSFFPPPSLGPFPPGEFDAPAVLADLMACLSREHESVNPGLGTSSWPGREPDHDVSSSSPYFSSSSPISAPRPPIPEGGGTQAEEASPPSSRTRSSFGLPVPVFQHQPYN